MNGLAPELSLPPAAAGALEIVRRLHAGGHVALLAGGCVRDLLLGHAPEDYDVATDAPPERVCAQFRTTRQVGAQFGVVLVRSRGRWVEVATFRSDGPYLDGRRPAEVHFSDARQDALRRDFTVNGMFYDPVRRAVVDYVDGQADLRAGLIRAIGDAPTRFAEDYLRLLRAVRFAARLAFEIEPRTAAAMRENAPNLGRVAAERVRDELERMLAHPQRRRAWELLVAGGFAPFLWPGAVWNEAQLTTGTDWLGRLPADAPFELAFALLVRDRAPDEIEDIARALTFSNEQRALVGWLVKHQGDLDDPVALSLAALKRLLAHRGWASLRTLAQARFAARPDGAPRTAQLAARVAAIPADAIEPEPFVNGNDLLERDVAAGPVYKRILDDFYTRQLNELIASRTEALVLLDRELAAAQRGAESED